CFLRGREEVPPCVPVGGPGGDVSSRRMRPLLASLGLLIAFVAASQAPRVAPHLVDLAPAAGLVGRTVVGEHGRKKSILETPGGGVALFAFDGDGLLDVFIVNGSRLPGSGEPSAGTSRLYRNAGNGSFVDVTARAGLDRVGWGQAVCAGDYDN